MLLSKLTPDVTKPLTRPKKVLPIGPYSVTDDRSSYLSLILYPECATGWRVLTFKPRACHAMINSLSILRQPGIDSKQSSDGFAVGC
jgi:hypothetical protein